MELQAKNVPRDSKVTENDIVIAMNVFEEALTEDCESFTFQDYQSNCSDIYVVIIKRHV